MKKIVLALTFVLVGSFMLAGCSKDEILNHYNNIVQSAGSIELTGKSSLQGEKEKGIDKKSGKVLIEIDPRYFRPAEVDVLLGDYSKAEKDLDWKPKTTFKKLVTLMTKADYEKEKQHAKKR